MWRRPDHPTGHDRFRQIFLDHWHRWHDLRLKDKVPPDQRAYVDKIIQRLQLCRDPDGGYALYICPGCQYELRVPRPRRPAKLDSVLPVAKSGWTTGSTTSLAT